MDGWYWRPGSAQKLLKHDGGRPHLPSSISMPRVNTTPPALRTKSTPSAIARWMSISKMTGLSRPWKESCTARNVQSAKGAKDRDGVYVLAVEAALHGARFTTGAAGEQTAPGDAGHVRWKRGMPQSRGRGHVVRALRARRIPVTQGVDVDIYTMSLHHTHTPLADPVQFKPLAVRALHLRGVIPRRGKLFDRLDEILLDASDG